MHIKYKYSLPNFLSISLATIIPVTDACINPLVIPAPSPIV